VSSPINYRLLNQLGVVWLVSGTVLGSPNQPILRVTLHDVVYSELKNVQAFTLPPQGSPEFRMAVHRVSDAVVEWATGEPGVAATRIAFRRVGEDGESDVWTIDSDGEGLRRLTRHETLVFSPAWSPEGKHLLYVAYVDGQPHVFERDMASGRRRLISAEPGLNITPTYSPDGSRILVARTTGDHTEVYELQREPLCCGRRITRTSGGDALNPHYAPDGTRFAFVASPLVQPHVYVQDVNSAAPEIISRYAFGEKGYATSPDWSPRGDRIAYHAWVDQVFQIVSVDPDGSSRRVLTSRGSNEDPSWGPDGRHLVFSSSQRTGHALLILDTVSGRIRRLTSGRRDQLAAWSSALD
jgi:TolB protein